MNRRPFSRVAPSAPPIASLSATVTTSRHFVSLTISVRMASRASSRAFGGLPMPLAVWLPGAKSPLLSRSVIASQPHRRIHHPAQHHQPDLFADRRRDANQFGGRCVLRDQ